MILAGCHTLYNESEESRKQCYDTDTSIWPHAKFKFSCSLLELITTAALGYFEPPAESITSCYLSPVLGFHYFTCFFLLLKCFITNAFQEKASSLLGIQIKSLIKTISNK